MPSFLKDKAEPSFFKASSPHLYAAHSSAQMAWGFFTALIPIWIAGIAAYGFRTVFIFILAVGICCGAQFLLGKRTWAQFGNIAFMGGLFALLMPAQISWVEVAVGSLMTALIGQMAFGGLGQNIFHPALIGYATLFLFSPDQFQPSETLGTANIFVIAFSAAILLIKRWIVWLPPFLYLAVLGALSVCLGRNLFTELVNSSVFFAAVFFLAHPVTMPITRKGQIAFAVTCAFLTAFLRFEAELLPAALCSVFFLNGFVPTFDRWVRPNLRTVS
jgi:electron transport complex protein RnfD